MEGRRSGVGEVPRRDEGYIASCVMDFQRTNAREGSCIASCVPTSLFLLY